MFYQQIKVMAAYGPGVTTAMDNWAAVKPAIVTVQ